MTLGEDEAVPIGPDGIGGVEAEHPLPEGVGDGGDPHRRAGVARVGPLDRVHAEPTNGVDREDIEVHCGQELPGIRLPLARSAIYLRAGSAARPPTLGETAGERR